MTRRLVLLAALLLWGTITFLTLYVLFEEGPDLLVLISLVVSAVMGFGIFGALTEKTGGPR